MRKIVLSALIGLILSSVLFVPSSADDKKLALGTKLLFILPALSGQYWLTNNLGTEVSIWPYGTSNVSFAWYEANLLYKVGSTGFQPIIGIGYMNVSAWSSNTSSSGTGTFVASVGARLGDEKFSFVPALELYSGSGGSTTLPTFSFHWFI